MKVYADLHVHSKYSRATSPQMDLEGLERGAKLKGIDLIGTGDFTHPLWFQELKNKLEEQDGCFVLKDSLERKIKFVLSAEISCIYTKGGKGRRIHLVVLAPSIADVEKISKRITAQGGNLMSDGRPILGMDAEVLEKLILEESPNALIIPAHIWTPWFSLFGANSGFNSLKDCFGEISDKIYAVETGLSSDPAMNWRIPELDNVSIVSFSDSHSLPKLGRECTVLELKDLSFEFLSEALKSTRNKKQETGNKILYTVEFYPEEGKYHWTGHRNCNISVEEKEAERINYTCPKCKKRLTVGVMNRVRELAGRGEDFKPENRPTFKSLVPLEEIVAEAMGQKVGTGKVRNEYLKIISAFGSEFKVLEDAEIAEIEKLNAKVADGVEKVRKGNIVIQPGYDGVYGVVKIWGEDEEKAAAGAQKDQMKLL